MQKNQGKSDIEQILETQTWKHKKLEPLTTKSRSIKPRSITEFEKPRKQERVITHPITLPESLIETPISSKLPTCRKLENRNSLSSLAVPFPIISSALTTISSRGLSFDLQVPVFPKREFGNSLGNKQIEIKFEKIQRMCTVEDIKELKYESGRIKKQSVRIHKKRFQFLDDFNQVVSEKAIKRMKTIYRDKE